MITKSTISQLSVGQELSDPGTPGLSIKKGSKTVSWYYRYYDSGIKKQRRVTIGRYPSIDINEAKIRALSYVDEGIDYCLEKVFLDFLAAKKRRGLRPTTITNYQQIYKNHLEYYSNTQLRKINKFHLRELHNKISKDAPYQANRVISLMRSIYNFASENYPDYEELNNPATSITFNKELPRERYLVPEAYSSLIMASYDEFLAIGSNASLAILLGISTGVRRGNLLSANAEEIDLNTGRWVISDSKSKNGKSLSVYIHPLILELVKHQIERSGYWLFPSNSKTGHAGDIRRNIESICQTAEIPTITLHTLRHTFITAGLTSDVSKFVVAKMVGHTPQDITSRTYGHISEPEIKKGYLRVADIILECIR